MITLDDAPRDTVQDVKRKIMYETGMPVDMQELIFDDEKLKDDRPIDYYNIQKGSTLQLNLRQRGYFLELFVETPTGETLNIFVASDDTILTVKRKIKQEGIPVDQHELTLDKKKLKDYHTVHYYNIRSHNTLRLALRQRDVHHMQLGMKDAD